ncbi:MarR family transcriptional regulator [Natronorubrum sulfidifaciens]
MSTNTQQFSVPDDLTAPQTKLVYLSLRVMEEATVTELQDLLALPKLTLLSVLESLVSSGFARRTEGGYASQ